MDELIACDPGPLFLSLACYLRGMAKFSRKTLSSIPADRPGADWRGGVPDLGLAATLAYAGAALIVVAVVLARCR